MSNQLVPQDPNTVIESVVIGGDLSKLSPADRVNYYKAVCSSVGLNPLTRPFDYITLNGKLTLYARKDATDQLRRINSVSIGKPDIQFQDEWIIVSVVASLPGGRTDSDVGVVKKTDMQGNMGNALMKAVTKAKRRVTLSICGLGFLDETEIETIPDAKPVTISDEGEIIEPQPELVKEPAPAKNNGKHLIAPQELVDAGIAENIAEGAGIINKLKLTKAPHDLALELATAYRAERDAGLTPDEAAAKVLAG